MHWSRLWWLFRTFPMHLIVLGYGESVWCMMSLSTWQHDHIKWHNYLSVGVKVLTESNAIISGAHIANIWIVVYLFRSLDSKAMIRFSPSALTLDSMLEENDWVLWCEKLSLLCVFAEALLCLVWRNPVGLSPCRWPVMATTADPTEE